MKTVEIDIDVNRAIESARISFEESHNAILRRLLGIAGTRRARASTPAQRLPRSSGAYTTVIGNTPVEANSLKELLRRVILLCEKNRPGLIDQLSLTPTQRGRRIVARSAAALYSNAPHLIQYAEKLDGDWWYDTNVGRRQVLAYLRILAEMLQLPHLPAIHKRAEKTTLTPEDLGL
ncbi:MAG: hypothetical protein JWQ89_2430 [Devosia sp.]|uniref:hypothetical protein n=1 Tax=Devosia sp. TaxID=1871048 RepID=UPI00260F02FD|nr:hypothetical protein [Devosia sp.]MDB5540703.1 hypothetical protein [Devosia sp.]